MKLIQLKLKKITLRMFYKYFYNRIKKQIDTNIYRAIRIDFSEDVPEIYFCIKVLTDIYKIKLEKKELKITVKIFTNTGFKQIADDILTIVHHIFKGPKIAMLYEYQVNVLNSYTDVSRQQLCKKYIREVRRCS